MVLTPRDGDDASPPSRGGGLAGLLRAGLRGAFYATVSLSLLGQADHEAMIPQRPRLQSSADCAPCLRTVSKGTSILNAPVCITIRTPQGERKVLCRFVGSRERGMEQLEAAGRKFRVTNTADNGQSAMEQITDITAEGGIGLHCDLGAAIVDADELTRTIETLLNDISTDSRITVEISYRLRPAGAGHLVLLVKPDAAKGRWPITFEEMRERGEAIAEVTSREP